MIKISVNNGKVHISIKGNGAECLVDALTVVNNLYLNLKDESDGLAGIFRDTLTRRSATGELFADMRKKDQTIFDGRVDDFFRAPG